MCGCVHSWVLCLLCVVCECVCVRIGLRRKVCGGVVLCFVVLRCIVVYVML